MHVLQKQFHEFIAYENLLEKDDKVLVAVSGGIDSMVLAHLLLKSSWSFAVAHCNFGLRGEESEGDDRFVKNWAKQHDIAIHSKRFDIGAGSTQVKARSARYAWFLELSEKHTYTKIATAHHLNDSLETLLINLARGTGIKGLAGIAISSENLIRPLLFAARKEIEAYARKTGLSWREDSSNLKPDYGRNRVRHEIVPKLEGLNPSLLHTFSSTVERLHFTGEIIKNKIEDVRNQYLKAKDGLLELDLSWFEKPCDTVILNEILSEYGFNYFTVKQVSSARGDSGKTFLSANWELTTDRQSLFLRPFERGGQVDVLIKKPGVYSVRGGQLIVNYKGKADVDFLKGPDVAFVDADQASFPLEVRSWKAGDRFQPLGMAGHKKVSDYLVDNKVPVPIKEKQLVVAHENQIIWLVGLRLAGPFKLTGKTERVLELKWQC